MKHVKSLSTMTATIAGLVLAGTTAAFFAPGADNGWDASTAMTETSPGVWEYSASGLGAGARTEWNIIEFAGDWGSQLHGSNQWGHADGNGDVTIILDTNTYSDGWAPSSNRIYTNTLALQSWQATGNWVGAAGLGNDWDLGTAPAMTNNGGIFEFVIPGGSLAPGIYEWKPVANGSWDSTGPFTGVNVNAPNSQFEVVGSETIIVQLDSSNGTTRFIPTPGAVGLLGIAGLAAGRRRRR